MSEVTQPLTNCGKIAWDITCRDQVLATAFARRCTATWPPGSAAVLACCSDNYVGGLGATVLANALAKNTSLRELYIKGNELGDTGVEALCKAFSGALVNAMRCDPKQADNITVGPVHR